MKKLVSTVPFLTLALPLLLLETVFGVMLTMYWLWERWLRTARELREAPPPGGMYGTMTRRLRARALRNASSQNTTNGGKNE